MQEETLSGILERITFHNEENGFAVLQVKTPGKREPVTVVGHVPVINTGEYIDAQGRWHMDQKYGLQFKAETLTSTPPTTREGILRYLSSGLVRGIGPTYARRLVEAFGDRVFEIIEKNPERLTEVPGIGPKRRDVIVASWEGQKIVRRIMLFLLSHGVGPLRAVRIWKAYGEEAISKIRANPYRLADDVRGIGFQIADKIARNLGVDPQSVERARAGLRYVLSELLSEGHAACPEEELLARARDLLEIPREKLEEALALERAEGRLLRENVQGVPWIYLARLWHAEAGVARRLLALLDAPHPLELLDPESAVREAERAVGIVLSPSQRRAVLMAAREKVLILTGGPGVGKTTIVKVILKLYRNHGARVVLAAPTGRAAKRLTEACGLEAKTLHRLLEADPVAGGFRRNRDNQLRADLVVVDEVSMVDLRLMYSLLAAVPAGAALLLVGDVDQLPSVGPGLVLSDAIASGKVPVARLNEIFRQEEASRIVVNAHLVNRGLMPQFENPERLSDFYFVSAPEPENVLRLLLILVRERIPARFRLDPVRDVQIIAPMVRGTLGVQNLNSLLQRELNPQPPARRLERFGRIFGLGDKVMQLANDYDRDVFNGDIGFVVGVDPEMGELEVLFEARRVKYTLDDLEDLTPAYAITIHKSQGCEFPAVIIPLHTQHYVMLQRNLLYTAITRGRRLVVLLGSKKAVAIAVRQAGAVNRYSALRLRLQGLLPTGR